MGNDLMIKCFRGVHALCHTRIQSLDTPSTVSGYAATFFNFVANSVPSPLPKMTDWATAVISADAYMNCYNLPFKEGFSSTREVCAGHVVKVALIFLLPRIALCVENVWRAALVFVFPRFALGMGAIALGSRLITCALSPCARDVISKVIENNLGYSGRRGFLRLRLAIACAYFRNAIDEHDRTFSDEQLTLFKNFINTDKIGEKNGVELTTPTGQTVATLGQQIIQELDDYQKLATQEQGNFDQTNLKQLSTLLKS
jgi:hypothetical protein